MHRDVITLAPALPFVFASPGLKPDVRIQVFDSEFHVHSIILKLHSSYFRKFLDSADKSDASDSASFQYEYSTVIDEDETNMGVAESKVRYVGSRTD